MKKKRTNLLILSALIAVSLALLGAPALAQNGNNRVKTDSKILYHNGPVMRGTSNVYLIWYGNWSGSTPGNNATTQAIVVDLMVNLGSSPYFQINHGYPDLNGAAPSGGLIYGGTVNDVYSHGTELTALGIQGIVADNLAANNPNLPLDPAGIYIVLASSDVSSNSTGFCTLNTPPHHGSVEFGGGQFRYAFIGNPVRCPTSAAPQFTGLPTPNDDLAADGMASTIAHALDATVTDPTLSTWYDRYGLENADKCQGTFGETYTTANGAQANMRLGQRHYLIQQNWVNTTRKGYCGLSSP